MAPNKFYGQEGVVKIGDNVTSVDTSTHLEGLMSSSTDYSGIVTEITVTDPEASVDIVNTFSGQVKNESPFDLVTVDFTMLLKDIDIFEEMHGSASSLSAGSSWTRISGSQNIGSKRDRSILFKLTRTVSGTTYTLHYLLNEAWFQQLGEVSLAGDGYTEVTGTAICLIDDRYMEMNF